MTGRYWLTRWVTRNLLSPYWQTEVCGLENLPRSGPLLLAGNHPSMYDGFALAGVLPFAIHYLIKERALKIPLIGPWLRQVGAIPVAPGVNSVALGLQCLQQGGCVLVYPEGEHTHRLEFQRFRRGAAELAKASRAALVPVLSLGSTALDQPHFAYVRGGPIRITFGAPLYCGQDEELADFTARLRGVLQTMMEQQPPLRPLRPNLRYRLCQLIWVPTTYLIFKLADCLRPGHRR